MRTVMIAFAATMLAGSASAATHYVPPRIDDLVGDTIDENRCTTSACWEAMAEIHRMGPSRPLAPVGQRVAVTPDAKLACVQANNDLGKWIAAANMYTTKNEVQSGGVLTRAEATSMRSMFFTETYFVRKKLRETIVTGNVSRCNQLRDSAIKIVNQIARKGFGYQGVAENQGPYYGR